MGYLGGFAVTFRQRGKKHRNTREYAKDEGNKRDKPDRLHGRHVLNRYEDGMEKCIGCELCAGVCPAKCIYVRGADNDPADPVAPGERYGFIYEINYLRCIHCDLCVEACPTEAITESKLFEFSFTNRSDAIYTKAELLVDDEGMPQQLPWEDWTDLATVARQSSAWVRATASSGAAEYEGRVGWSGELGFGVKAAEVGQSADDPAPPTVVGALGPGASNGTDFHGDDAPERVAEAEAPLPGVLESDRTEAEHVEHDEEGGGR